jgi:hypothetical protein
MTNYLYIKSQSGEHDLYTVGFYRPDGTWEPESDWSSLDQCVAHLHYLNGGLGVEALVRALEAIAQRLAAIELELDLLRRAK